MEKEKELKGLKLKLMTMLASLVICLLFVSVSVYAALNQTVIVNDSIQIKNSGQSVVAVRVESAKGSAGAVNTLLSSDLDNDADANLAFVTGAAYTTMINVAAGESEDLDYNAANAPVFSYTNGYTFYAYKITLTNESVDTAATYTIAQTFAGNDQIDVYYSNGTNFTDTPITSGSLSEVDGGSDTATIYIIYAVNESMENLTPSSVSQYTLTINIAAVQA